MVIDQAPTSEHKTGDLFAAQKVVHRLCHHVIEELEDTVSKQGHSGIKMTYRFNQVRIFGVVKEVPSFIVCVGRDDDPDIDPICPVYITLTINQVSIK